MRFPKFLEMVASLWDWNGRSRHLRISISIRVLNKSLPFSTNKQQLNLLHSWFTIWIPDTWGLEALVPLREVVELDVLDVLEVLKVLDVLKVVEAVDVWTKGIGCTVYHDSWIKRWKFTLMEKLSQQKTPIADWNVDAGFCRAHNRCIARQRWNVYSNIQI